MSRQVQDAYDRWASTYDSDGNLTRDLDRVVVRRVLGDRPVLHLLELGCGTGKNTSFLQSLTHTLVGLDFSAGMLAQARRRVSGTLLVQADLTHPWPLPAGRFDLVTASLVLEHIDRLEPLFAEARRVLRDGGRFFVCELHPFWQYEGKQAVFQEDGEEVKVPAFLHHLSDFLSAADAAGLAWRRLDEWWHASDEGRPPRLVSFLFARGTGDAIRL